jgi:hypothetical protein
VGAADLQAAARAFDHADGADRVILRGAAAGVGGAVGLPTGRAGGHVSLARRMAFYLTRARPMCPACRKAAGAAPVAAPLAGGVVGHPRSFFGGS